MREIRHGSWFWSLGSRRLYHPSQTGQSLGVRPIDVPPPKRNRAIISETERLQEDLLPLRQAGLMFTAFIHFALIVEALR